MDTRCADVSCPGCENRKLFLEWTLEYKSCVIKHNSGGKSRKDCTWGNSSPVKKILPFCL